MTNEKLFNAMNRREFVRRMVGGMASIGLSSQIISSHGRADQKPNILFLMTDQMQGRVLDPDHVCQTPNLDRLAKHGVRFTRAYTPSPTCSPARASLMTGLLPHSHGMVQVTQCMFDDQGVLRTDKPHWAKELTKAGYLTAYFGKWHVERSMDLARYGWQINAEHKKSEIYQTHKNKILGGKQPENLFYLSENLQNEFSMSRSISDPPGYPSYLLYGITKRTVEERMIGMTCHLAKEFLKEAVTKSQPWCCFVSILEPHDPFVATKENLNRYDINNIPVPANWYDDLSDRPGLYRKCAIAWGSLTEQEKKEAAACYYASISEIDEQYGQLIGIIEKSGKLDNTIIIFTSDHGEFLGSHGLYNKGIGSFEEAYNVPLIIRGPGIYKGGVSNARVGLQDLCPTLLELAGLEPFNVPDSRSFFSVLKDPSGQSANFIEGYSEYYGARFWLTQRILWDGPWKFIWNCFDFDELYNLDDDPYEMKNLADDARYQERVHKMMSRIWEIIHITKDLSLEKTIYPNLRLAPVGMEYKDNTDMN